MCIRDSSCPYAKGHFDRINDAIFELMTTKEHYSREEIEACAQKYKVCPFELGLDMSLFSDGILCDYNYVFDPHVYLRRFFGEGAGREQYLFLIDESHNLLERGREMYSAQLYKEDFLTLKKTVKAFSPRMEKILDKCNRELLFLKRECGDWCIEMCIRDRIWRQRRGSIATFCRNFISGAGMQNRIFTISSQNG